MVKMTRKQAEQWEFLYYGDTYGDVTPQQAKKLVMDLLQRSSVSEEPDEGFPVHELYARMQCFTQMALAQNRRDEELRGWYDFLKFLSFIMMPVVPQYGLRFEALYELLYISIQLSAEDVVTNASAA